MILQVGIKTDQEVEGLKKCLDYLRKSKPDVKVIIYGLECPLTYEEFNSIYPNCIETNERLKQVAREYQLPFIDFLTGETLAGDGSVLSKNISKAYITSENKGACIKNMFLTEEGHKVVGKEVAEEMAKVLNWYGIKVKGVTADVKTVEVEFKVKIKEILGSENEKEITNIAKVNGKDTNPAEVVVKKISTEHLNTISISKVDENNKKLSGAILQLLNSENTEIDQWKTEDDEHIILNLPDGTYTLKELEAPEGYDITNDISIVVNENQESPEITMQDELTKVSIKLKKIDSWKEDKTLSGAEFKLVKMKEENGKLTEDESFQPKFGKTDANGIFDFKDVVYGKYRLYETKAPEGYNLLQDYITVNVNSDTVKDKIVNVEVKNKETLVLPETGSIESIGSKCLIIAGMYLIGRSLLKRKVIIKKMKNKNKKIIRRKGKHY